MSSQSGDPASEEVAALIEKQLRREVNVRFLRGMPAFRADHNIPQTFKSLLSRLESAERRAMAIEDKLPGPFLMRSVRKA